MRPVVLVIALVAACRWNFDAVGTDGGPGGPDATDAPAGHDEDGDGVPDSTDTCPHVDGDQADRDGDGVGDLCDPAPDTAGEQLVLFDPMITGSGFEVVSASWEDAGDAYRCDASTEFCEIKRPLVFDRGIVEIGVDVVVHVDTAPQHQISISLFDTPLDPYDYVEVYETGTSAGYAAVTSFDGTTYLPLTMQAMTSGIHTGRLRLQYAVTAPTPTVGVTARWSPEVYETSVPIANHAAGSFVAISAQGLVVELAYIAAIAAP